MTYVDKIQQQDFTYILCNLFSIYHLVKPRESSEFIFSWRLE